MSQPISSPDVDRLVLAEVYAERCRQDAKWGEQNHPNGTASWAQPLLKICSDKTPASLLAELATYSTDYAAEDGTLTYADIFLEEVFEAVAEEDPEKLRAELIQCAAVAVAWVEKIDRDAS